MYVFNWLDHAGLKEIRSNRVAARKFNSCLSITYTAHEFTQRITGSQVLSRVTCGTAKNKFYLKIFWHHH